MPRRVDRIHTGAYFDSLVTKALMRARLGVEPGVTRIDEGIAKAQRFIEELNTLYHEGSILKLPEEEWYQMVLSMPKIRTIPHRHQPVPRGTQVEEVPRAY
jgi:hypothetical protein